MSRRLFLALPALALLAGCISFGPKAPKLLLAMTATSVMAAGAARTATDANTILVLTPTAPVAIQTSRIPVYDGATDLAYVADAAWNEPPARALQRLMSETIAARTSRVVLDPRQFSASPALRLSGQLQRFGIDPRAMTAVGVFDAQVARAGGVIETRRFAATVPVSAIEGRAAGSALNGVANDLAAQVAAWVG